MAVRPPSARLKKTGTPVEGLLDYEIAGEMASALGRAGRNVEIALRRLKQIDTDDPGRDAALRQAVRAVYAYLVQRELCGLRRHETIIREYGIPREVLVRLGAS